MEVVRYTLEEKPVAPPDSPKKGEWRVDLQGLTILAFGGGGNLSEPFLYAAAECGAQIAIADFLPDEKAAADEQRERILTIARRIARRKSPNSGSGAELPPVVFGDVRNSTDIKETVEHVAEQFGRIDVGIDFAGIHHRPFDLVREAPEDLEQTFRSVIDINLNGAFLITAHLSRQMAAQRSGHIIHLCSNGSRLSLYGSYAYNASKHGLEGIVKTAAAQMAPFGVRVNAIAPGTVETNLNRSLLRDEAGELRPRARSILAHTPSKRFCTREGVTASLLSMCIPQPHFTGNVLFADDGYNIEGHSWPEGNQALFAGQDELESLFQGIDAEFPPRNGFSATAASQQPSSGE
ncbi:MAG: SDR family oxidoreductase [Spirochaetia bacterium]|nr:SDR family oxidoreductase [Spirochaetia bacterium]